MTPKGGSREEPFTRRISQLKADAAVMRHYGQEHLAVMVERIAADLQADLDEHLATPLTPAQAEAEGICDAETVRRKVREGKLENVGTPGAIKVPRGKIPRGRGARKKTGTSFQEIAMRAVAGTLTRRG